MSLSLIWNNTCLDSGDIAFVTYEKGEAEAKIRFKKGDAAKPVSEKWTEAVNIKDHKVQCNILEVKYFLTFLYQMSSLYYRKFLLSVHHKPNI